MAQKREKEEKQITDMLCAAEVRLEALPFTVKGRKTNGSAGVIRAYSMTGEEQIDSIDTIVNSASPDLMGGKENTVDWLLHKLIDGKLTEKGEDCTFNQKICVELAGRNAPVISEEEECISRIRCPRGKAVLTRGYGLCDYVIHAVGTRLQPKEEREDRAENPDEGCGCLRQENYQFGHAKGPAETCTSSCIQLLESCYHEIVRLIRQYPDIRHVAVPIIGSGNYGVDFEIAARIAVSAAGNALMEWKYSDEESFETSRIEKILFFVMPGKTVRSGKNRCGAEEREPKKQIDLLKEIFEEYKDIYYGPDHRSCRDHGRRGHQVVFQDSFTAQRQYYNEIVQNDENRGYFAIAKLFRRGLVKSRMFFGLVSNKVKDSLGKQDWQKRRTAVECITLAKLLFPIMGIFLVRYCPCASRMPWSLVLSFLIFYLMADTVTYLLSLIMMADIQKPSANIIRSLLLLLFNYIEVSLDMAYFYYVYGEGSSGTGALLKEALAFGVLGQGADEAVMSAVPDMIMGYANTGLKFFFLTVVFGYLVQHMRQRKFKGE